MSETNGKEIENLNQNEHRRVLFNVLRHVIETSREKFDKEKAANRDRQSWGRLIVSGIEAYAKLLEGTQLEAIERRLDVLEQEKEVSI
jgi:hypothetical protein